MRKSYMFSFDKVQLTLDRTNWKWGKRNINILMLAIVYRGIAIPIVWTLLNKRGNSDTKERIALIQRFISIFGKDRIVNVFADREFIDVCSASLQVSILIIVKFLS